MYVCGFNIRFLPFYAVDDTGFVVGQPCSPNRHFEMEKGKHEESLVNTLKLAPDQQLQGRTLLEGSGYPAVCLKHSQEHLGRFQSCLHYPFFDVCGSMLLSPIESIC